VSAVTPGVSVVIPALNAEGTIAEQLAAVLAQECPLPFEVVVADNRSTDSTRDIVRTSAEHDSRLRIIDASESQGDAVARNAGVDASRSPFVAFCDADDVVQPGWLAAIHDALTSGAHAVNVTREYWSLNPGRQAAGGLEMVNTAWVAGGAFAVRRGLFLQLGGFDPAMPTASDTEFGFRLRDRMGRHPMQLTSAVVSVREPQDTGAIFVRARELSRARRELRKRHPRHLPSSTTDVVRFRMALIRDLAIHSPDLATARRAGWMERLGALTGDLEGSVAGTLSRVTGRL